MVSSSLIVGYKVRQEDYIWPRGNIGDSSTSLLAVSLQQANIRYDSDSHREEIWS